jgi:hypothetical protein
MHAEVPVQRDRDVIGFERRRDADRAASFPRPV